MVNAHLPTLRVLPANATNATNVPGGVHGPVRLNTNPSCSVTVSDYECTVCDPGEVVLSAGGYTTNDWAVVHSYPTGQTTWHFKCLDANGSPQGCAGFRALCAKISP